MWKRFRFIFRAGFSFPLFLLLFSYSPSLSGADSSQNLSSSNQPLVGQVDGKPQSIKDPSHLQDSVERAIKQTQLALDCDPPSEVVYPLEESF